LKKLTVHIIIFLHLLVTINAVSQEPASPDTTIVGVDSSELPQSSNPVQDSFYLRQVPDSVLIAVKKQRIFAYANDADYWVKKTHEPTAIERLLFYLFTHDWIKWLFYGLLGILLGYTLFRILQATRLNLFFTQRGKRQENYRADPEKQDWNALLAGAEKAGDYRLAIRCHFLHTLQLLEEKNILTCHPETTNQEYLNQLRGKQGFESFSQLTRIYEYVWYGGFGITEPLYRQAASLFHSFQESLS
jgi:hypothetical protein